MDNKIDLVKPQEELINTLSKILKYPSFVSYLKTKTDFQNIIKNELSVLRYFIKKNGDKSLHQYEDLVNLYNSIVPSNTYDSKTPIAKIDDTEAIDNANYLSVYVKNIFGKKAFDAQNVTLIAQSINDNLTNNPDKIKQLAVFSTLMQTNPEMLIQLNRNIKKRLSSGETKIFKSYPKSF